MERIELFERVLNGAKLAIPADLIHAYVKSGRSGNELINFDDCIREYTVSAICRTLKEVGVTEFTISSTFSSLIPILAIFEEKGWKMNGIVTVNAAYKDYVTHDWEKLPAIKMTYKGDRAE